MRKQTKKVQVKMARKTRLGKPVSCKLKIEKELSLLVLELDPTANVISSATSIYSHMIGHAAKPRFLTSWIAHGPEFISSKWVEKIEHEIGFHKLNRKIKDRLKARAAKDWTESDRIRDDLAGIGIVLKDNKDGTTTWEVAA
jgi:cysteinyl-tRNA synthetase